MEIEELIEIIETMALQHSYPGFDVRALKLGLPHEAVNAPAKLFAQALRQDKAIVKLAALRWFWERPGVAKRYCEQIGANLDDKDEWVRLEAVRTIGRLGNTENKFATAICQLLKDSHPEIRKATAHTIWKLGLKDDAVIASLMEASNDPDIEVKWKIEKALRKLGHYQ